MNLALIENGAIKDIVVGDPNDPRFANRIDATGEDWGVGWLGTGTGPFVAPPFVQQYATTFLPDAFLAELTEDEFDLLDASNNAAAKKFLRRLESRKTGAVTVTPTYVSDIGALLTANVISQARHDELIQGIPI